MEGGVTIASRPAWGLKIGLVYLVRVIAVIHCGTHKLTIVHCVDSPSCLSCRDPSNAPRGRRYGYSNVLPLGRCLYRSYGKHLCICTLWRLRYPTGRAARLDLLCEQLRPEDPRVPYTLSYVRPTPAPSSRDKLPPRIGSYASVSGNDGRYLVRANSYNASDPRVAKTCL